MELNAVDILRVLPHRYPFLLVDRILECEPGKRAIGLKNVTLNEQFFIGHFPDHPIMPGVLIVEMMAQVGGVVVRTIPEHSKKLAYIAGIEKCRFRKPVLPGDTLVADLEIIYFRGNLGKLHGVARVGDDVVCNAEILFAMIMPEKVGIPTPLIPVPLIETGV